MEIENKTTYIPQSLLSLQSIALRPSMFIIWVLICRSPIIFSPGQYNTPHMFTRSTPSTSSTSLALLATVPHPPLDYEPRTGTAHSRHP